MMIDPLLGPAFPDLGWVPAPRYLMRRARIVQMMHGLEPGSVLEIGPGAATLLTEFAREGFQCEALELSAPARELANQVGAAAGQSIQLHDEAGEQWHGRFDYIFAFDVLEHIEDDTGALAQWISWLKPGGRLMLSVPAHMALWTAGDEWAGHFRRYERAELKDLLVRSGLEIEHFECYGFPLTNLSERVSASSYRTQIHADGQSSSDDRKKNNDRSGIDRGPHLRIYPLMKSWPGKLAIRFFLLLQKAFLKSDLGSGYVLRARRP